MYQEDKPNPFPLNPIYNPNDWPGSRPTLIDVAFLDANYLKFPVAQAGTEILSDIIVNGTLNVPNNDALIRGSRIGLGPGAATLKNIIFGDNCGTNNTTGAFNVLVGSNCGAAVTTGTKNTFVGAYSGIFNTSGGFNTFVGQDAGNSNASGNRNTYIGREAGLKALGSDNICIGNQSDCSGNITNSIAIGSGVKVDVSNSIVLGLSTQSTRISGTSNFENTITLSGTTADNRSISSSYYRLLDTFNPPTSLGKLYATSQDVILDCDENESSFSINCKDVGGNKLYVFGVNSTEVNSNSNLRITGNKNLIMSTGTGIISQSLTTNDISTTNNLKRTSIVYNNSGNTTANPALEVYESAGRGVYVVPNVTGGAYGPNTQTGDTAFITRHFAMASTSMLFATGTSLRNHLRLYATTDLSNCSLVLQNGANDIANTSEFRMDYNFNATPKNTISFNNPINFNPTNNGAINSNRRVLTGLGTLSFTDISGNDTTTGSVVSRIWTDTSLVSGLSGMSYDCGINNGFHQFSARDSGGNISTPIYYGSAITSVSNTFIVRNATTTSNRFDVLTDGSQNTYIRARSTTASTDAHIHFNCDSVNAGGTTTNNAVLNFTPTFINIRRPIQFNYLTTPSASTQLGYVLNPEVSASSLVASSTSVRNFGSFTITNAGTYNIQVLITLLGGANHTLIENSWCLHTVSASFPSITTPTKTAPSITGVLGTSLSSTLTAYVNINLNVTATASEIYYINYVLNYSGGTNTTISRIVSYARIG